MRRILFSFFLLLHVCVQAQQDPNFHVYLLVGQSNMAGRGKVDEKSKQINPRIFMMDSLQRWIPATDPVHFDKPKMIGVGPALGFAEAMLPSDTSIRIGLIPCAWGGSPIKVWEPQATYLNAKPYDFAIERAKLAMQAGVLKGVIWHQGESDNDSARSAVYIQKLSTFVQRLRTDLGIADLPFVAGEIGHFLKRQWLNKVLQDMPKQIPHTALVSAKDLDHLGDTLHFNTASARLLGQRYAVAMKSLQQSSILPPTVVLTFDDAEKSHLTNVAPLLKKYGFNATFYVCEMPLKQASEADAYMRWEEIAALHRMGFEIGNHTARHKNMTKLTVSGMQEEVSFIEQKCLLHGIPRPISFAYPGNRSDSTSQAVLKQMGYHSARAGGSTYYNSSTNNAWAIPSYTMGSTEKLEKRTWDALHNLMPGQTLVFTIHGVPDVLHPDYSTSMEMLEAVFQYMKEHQFRVIAMKNLIP